MKVLQINCVWNKGSTGKIVYDIHNSLKQKNIESVVCYGRGKKTNQDNIHKVSTELEAKIHSVFSRLFGVQFAFSPIATAKTIKIIKRENPDVVHLHCLNGNFINVYKILEFLKKKEIRTILTLHAEIMHTAGCDYDLDCDKWKTECHNCKRIQGKVSKFFRDDAKYCYKRMKQAFLGFKDITVVGVSEWLTNRAKISPVFSNNVIFKTVRNGIDISVFKRIEYDLLFKKYGISCDKKIILHVTPNFNNSIKGGKYVLEAAKRFPQHQFVIVGFNGEKSVLPTNVLPIKHTDSKEEMAMFYSMADITLLTSRKETFSMVVAESLCCGTPIVGFEAGAPETIAIPEYSSFTKQGDIDLLCEKLNEFLLQKFDREEISKKAVAKYDAKAMAEKYMQVYNLK